MTRLLLFALAVMCLSSCGPKESSDTPPTFESLFQANCSGCHGPSGHGGAAPPLNNAIYQAVVPPEVLQSVVANGRPGTAMPGFAKSSGGKLAPEEIQLLVDGMQRRKQPQPDPPPYEDRSPADPRKGRDVFERHCAGCHKSVPGDITDPTFLSLVSDQFLRTTVIAGRPQDGCPDARQGALTNEEITAVVAWLSSQRNTTMITKVPGGSQ